MTLLLAALLLMAALAATGCASHRGPTSPSDGPGAGVCNALQSDGATGGQRIQNAINSGCRTVQVPDNGPDGGRWNVREPIIVRSDVTIEGTGGQLPVLLASADIASLGMIAIVSRSNVSIRRINLQGDRRAPNGIFIQDSRDVTISEGVVARVRFLGVHVTGAPSTNVTVAFQTFEDNGLIDVRTDTSDASAHHANVRVRTNIMRGAEYGVALANCGNAPATACEARDNQTQPRRSVEGSGVDLNRSHFATVAGNTVSGQCVRGITVDDTRNATISGNRVSGCSGDGILLANGAVTGHRPWMLIDNRVTDNVVTGVGGYGLAAFRREGDSADVNRGNAWANNRLEQNARGGCRSNAEQQSFVNNGPQPCNP